MITKSKIAVNAAIEALSFASPALAQSFDNDFGTGNELPSYYDSHGGVHAGMPRRHERIRQSQTFRFCIGVQHRRRQRRLRRNAAKRSVVTKSRTKRWVSAANGVE
jgi:hypothetical protein